VQCLEDRSEKVRKQSHLLFVAIRNINLSLYDSIFKRVNLATQRLFLNVIEKDKEPSEKKIVKNVQPINSFASQSTLAKKQKRFQSIPSNLGQIIISNKQILSSVFDKCKVDAQLILPNIIYQKLFSSSSSEQIEALEMLKKNEDFSSVAYSSDLIVRWFIVRFFDKNQKLIFEGIKFLCQVFKQDFPISLQEMEILLPIIFWSFGNKLIDSLFDLVSIIRVYSDPTEYSLVLRSCIEGSNEISLVHIFSELQFTVTGDPSNSSIFFDCIHFCNHSSDEVMASVGGYLGNLYSHMIEEEKTNLLSKLSTEKFTYVSSVIPIEIAKLPDFEEFSSASIIEKIVMIREMLDRIKTKLSSIQQLSSIIILALSEELTKQKTEL
jgi:hypothetical protein